ncbi:hypothetical protein AXG93_694s1010 [Marchantia polymorpha subsp. ruderalis]|uniref:CCHC-type domain-containing protein n=1 Tax=Marchantia polymorpha subsp. ruderalis TaxID=1480154 RepID=A0A176W388_MARPO|nr:hypothetical protein AXG93_694s1010 [Marchantia polymorpha subsp. ruderalis]
MTQQPRPSRNSRNSVRHLSWISSRRELKIVPWQRSSCDKRVRLEKSEDARKVDEELLRRLQSQCDELRAQRAEAELQFVEVDGDSRRATDRTREELAARVNRCLRGYIQWEVIARERVTLHELEIRAAALMSGDSRSRRRVAKRLDAFLARSRDTIAHLKAEARCCAGWGCAVEPRIGREGRQRVVGLRIGGIADDYKRSGDDDDADSYIKLFESVSTTNRETSDDDRLRIFPSLLRKKARSWYNHESTDPNGLQTWAQLKEKFLQRFRELGYDSRVLTKLRNLQRERKENLCDYMERFQDLLDRIPKTGAGVPFSTLQAVDWYVTGLTQEMETFCRRGKCDTVEDVIASAEAFETSTLNRRGRERRESVERKVKGGRRKRRGATPSSEEPSSAEGSTSSEKEETSSSEEDRKKKKRTATKKKGHRRGAERGPGDIASKVETLMKDFADLKVHVVGGQDRRKSPAKLRANLWCTTCGQVGHANTECLTTWPSYPVNAVD